MQSRRTLGGMSVETMVATSDCSILAATSFDMALLRRLPQSARQASGFTPAGPVMLLTYLGIPSIDGRSERLLLASHTLPHNVATQQDSSFKALRRRLPTCLLAPGSPFRQQPVFQGSQLRRGRQHPVHRDRSCSRPLDQGREQRKRARCSEHSQPCSQLRCCRRLQNLGLLSRPQAHHGWQ
jgi:hypothetical protein